jgi:hypothetical protein
MSYKNIVMEDNYPDPITKEAFANAQELIGVKLPGLLYELIKDYDEGHPKDNRIYLMVPGGGVMMLMR